MPQVKEHLKNIKRTGSKVSSRGKTLRLDMNECVQGLPAPFVKRALGGIDRNFLSMYPEYADLVGMIARHAGLKRENICISNGSDAAIKYIFDAYVSSGDKILLTDPTFAMYPLYCRMVGARPITIPYNNDLSFPYRRFIDKIEKGVKMAVIVNPNNPAGSTLGNDELLAIIKKADKNDVLVVIDEAYHYFYPHSVIKEVKKFKNLIVLRTFSKLCALAAARLGYAAGDKAIIDGINKVKPTYDVNGIAVLMAKKLLQDKTMIPMLVKDALAGKEYLVKNLKGAGIRHEAGHANFVLIECKGRVNEIRKRLRNENILVHGGFKQPFLKDYIRVTIGDKSAMKRFFRCFIRIWDTPRRKVNG